MDLRKSKLGEQSRKVKDATSGFYAGPFREAMPELDGESLIEVGNKMAAGQKNEKKFEIARVFDGLKARVVLDVNNEEERTIAQNFLYKLKKRLQGE